MSAGPAPPNPGQPRKGPATPKPSIPTSTARYGPRLLLGGVMLGAAYAYIAYKPLPSDTKASDLLRSPGVKNIEGAYQKGGATSTHTKGYGGTPQGTKTDVVREGGGTGKPNGLDHDGIGEEQRPVQPTKAGEVFHDFKYGSSGGK